MLRRTTKNSTRWAAAAALVGLASMSSLAEASELVSPPDPAAIIGGEAVASCQWPSTVFLENCTGTLIHPEIVVYAAHCGSAERVWFAESVADGQPTPADGFPVDTEYCWTNPDYPTQQDIGPSRAADYAFCKLAEPVVDVPIVPALMGCETTVLTSNAPVTLVGFGGTDQDTFGVKFTVDTVLHYIDDWGVAVIGGEGQSPCAGDSGGPAFVQVPDGTWRAFGIVSGPNIGNCGDAMWFPTIHSAIPDIERISGIDVTPCHFGGSGQWNPSPGCRDFPLAPNDGAGTTWADGCGGGPVAEWSSTCGPAFDESEDLLAPLGAVTEPEDRTRIDTPEDSRTAAAVIVAEASDAVSGVAWVELIVNGEDVPGSRLVGEPWQWDVDLPPGVLQLRARAGDWAGNESETDVVVIGVDVDPPAAPEGGSSSGAADTGTGDGDTETGDSTTSTTTGLGTTSTAETDDGSSGTAASDGAGGDDGCGCRTSSQGGGPASLLLLLGGLLARRRRCKAESAVLAAALALASTGCDGGGDSQATGDDGTSTGASQSTGPQSTSSTSSTTGASSSESSTSSTSSTSSSSTTTGSECASGTLDCVCTSDFTCDEGLACALNTCVECQAGAITCPCRAEDAPEGRCDEELNCFGGVCSSPHPCPFIENLVCDEPEGSGICLEGTDPFDCCAVEPGVCEEMSRGGRCPDGSDPNDCDTATGSSSTGATDSGADTEA